MTKPSAEASAATEALTDRQMMEMAIKQMRLSVPERGKNNPLVGAAIRLPDGTVHGAHRAHLRDGAHAEHSLLDQKLLQTDLTGSHLFVTLEPCGPGSRGDKEKPCAERIAEARVSELWFGIQDPHHLVDGRGLAYLRAKKIIVRQFDPDLQEVIRAENAEWLAAAMQAAAKHQAGVSSDLFDRVFPKATVADLSTAALNFYRRHKKIKHKVDSPEFRLHLHDIGILDGVGIDAHLTGFGAILFGDKPRRFVPQAGLNAVIHVSDELEIPERFDSPGILIPDQVEEWLKKNFPDAESRDRMVRKPVERLPYKAIREAVINALVHRDYTGKDASKAKCHLSVSEDKIVVKSPGGPVPPVTLAELTGLCAGVYMRNTSLVYYFAELDLMEEQNLGMKTFKLLPKSGYPLPAYSFESGLLTLTIFRTVNAASAAEVAAAFSGLSVETRSLIGCEHEKGWVFLATRTSITALDYAQAMSLTERTAQRHLRRFAKLGLIERVGAARATGYRILGPGAKPCISRHMSG
ncbi:MAG: hypothetical protein HYZ53_31230 [Planctomycetes bacterium]|nr:hypothetical protein [Planctomycetota bacterium]